VPVDQAKNKGQHQARGQGHGPLGKPRGVKEMNNIQATKLVDVILSGKYNTYKKVTEAVDRTDEVLDELENKLGNVPDQDIDQLSKRVSDELSVDQSAPVEEKISIAMSRLIKEEAYREYFKKMMKRYNVRDIKDLSPAKKKAFFNAVDKNWKSKKERKK